MSHQKQRHMNIQSTKNTMHRTLQDHLTETPLLNDFESPTPKEPLILLLLEKIKTYGYDL